MLGSEKFSVLKLCSRALKDEQCENPRVCPPESATKSLTPNPLLAKLLISVEVFENGDGKFIVSLANDTRPSFLPLSTFHHGP